VPNLLKLFLQKTLFLLYRRFYFSRKN